MRRVLLINIVATYLILSYSNAQTVPHTFGILKPNLKADTTAILKHNIKRIEVYTSDIFTDSTNQDFSSHDLYGYWDIYSDSSKIINSKWTWADSTTKPYWDFYSKFHVAKKNNKKIIEKNYNSTSDRFRLRMTHILDSTNNVKLTKFEYLTPKFEDSYSLINEIDYVYDEDLLNEISFYNTGFFVKKHYCYLKINFSYE